MMDRKEYYQRNKEKIKERVRKYRRTHKKWKQQYDKKYRESHKEWCKEYSKQYRREHHDELKRKSKEYRLKNRDRLLQKKKLAWRKKHPPYIPKHQRLGLTKKEYKSLLDKQWREKNKNRIKQNACIYYQNNKEKFKQYSRKQRKNKPEIKLKSDKKHLEKYGFVYDLSTKQYKYALLAWSKTIRNRDNYQCQVCFEPAQHAHHIFYKSNYPKLALNSNNGISLCEQHHHEIHGVG